MRCNMTDFFLKISAIICHKNIKNSKKENIFIFLYIFYFVNNFKNVVIII